jgi:hypothetical protein
MVLMRSGEKLKEISSRHALAYGVEDGDFDSWFLKSGKGQETTGCRHGYMYLFSV